MFLDSVIDGLKVLLHWEVYVVGLEYFVIILVPRLLVGVLLDGDSILGSASGVFGLLVLPIFSAAAMIIFIFTLAPILLGIGEEALWSFPWLFLISAPVPFLKILGFLIVISVVSSIIPIVGSLPAFNTFVVGGATLMFILGIMESLNTGSVFSQVDLLPSFWFFIGVIAVGGIVSGIGGIAAVIISAPLNIAAEGLGEIISLPIIATFGFFPVFIYGAWLGAQLGVGY